MTPQDFIAKWRAAELKERSGSHSHFNDLCALLGLADPATADPKGEWFTFEKGLSKTAGAQGWADVWRKGCFAWEYKGPRKDLDKAFNQLLQYSVVLENPPLLIVSDMDRIRIHTNWTNTVQEVHDFTLEDLIDGDTREKLKRAFTDPEHFKPTKTRQALTEETAKEFAGIAQRLRDRGHDPHKVAHFVNQLVFCMFAEDVGLLPDNLFTKMLKASRTRPERFEMNARKLFGAMATGGDLDFSPIDWFNGGLFADDFALPVEAKDIDELLSAAERDWSQIDPSILGTLFERGLDPAKRSQLGAHYTDREKIMMIVQPVIIDPLEFEWAEALGKAKAAIETADAEAEAALQDAKDRGELADEIRLLEGALRPGRQQNLFDNLPRQKRVRELDAVRKKLRDANANVMAARDLAKKQRDEFLLRLRNFRVLDPACGSGNFLYVALRSLKDIEHRANIDAEILGVERASPQVGPECVLGIELNPYAAELARVSVWIGEIQWMRRNGFDAAKNPILRTLDTIECRDAVLAWEQKPSPEQADPRKNSSPERGGGSPLGLTEGAQLPDRAAADRGDPSTASRSPSPFRGGFSEDAEPILIPVRAEWPAADVVVGNPPFLGGSKILGELGDNYTTALRKAWGSDVPGFADLVCYWFAKAFEQMSNGNLTRAGLVSTNSIRGGANREVLKPIVESGRIFEAWSDEPWTVDGAAVRVSLICFDRAKGEALLDGLNVQSILSDLTANEQGFDLTLAVRLSQNELIACYGSQQKGSFGVSGDIARSILRSPNPHSRPNTEVVKRSINAIQITRGMADGWVIDFGLNMTEWDAALFEKPFEIVRQQVLPERSGRRDAGQAKRWWLHARPSPVYRNKAAILNRYIVSPAVSKHRLFTWLTPLELADHALLVFARDDDTSFGILHSTFHELWSLRMGTSLEDRPRYTPSTTFETFPFPEGLTPNIAAADYADDPRAIFIATASARLNELRENWLNPPDLVVRKPEVVAGYPDRILPRDEVAAKELAKRTLTNLYNARPAWLDNAHKALDEAVAEAYGWGDDWRTGLLTEDEILARLFRLNQERAKV
ncbi:class I SAM-dependent DNA methyltransferase [Sphingorhabdus sp.]|jgi:type II restriction/modification system DNA methylase subunit YeeA|uniref:class I SAM-dependent DNA methyltransferase n=1 Tax=Sphingorhabdus sp. TaxID=1902408 RepID=UPI0037C71529